MARKSNDWKVAGIVWEDAASSLDPMTTPCPVISFGIPVWDKERKFWRIYHDIFAAGGGSPESTTAIPRGMKPRVVIVGKIEVPAEFRKFWSEHS